MPPRHEQQNTLFAVVLLEVAALGLCLGADICIIWKEAELPASVHGTLLPCSVRHTKSLQGPLKDKTTPALVLLNKSLFSNY